MARYEHLPIYRDALELAVHFEKIVTGFSRYHKYTLGSELRNASRKTVTLIIQANNQVDKTAGLLVLRDHLEETLLLIRIAKETKAFKSFNAYSHIVELTAKVCRQNEGWLKSLHAKTVNKADKSARMS
ncbi:MAG: four helix bundle protein [Methylococcales bacterium]|nr:four helix bundle protein [Methylococcales bacterium]